MTKQKKAEKARLRNYARHGIYSGMPKDEKQKLIAEEPKPDKDSGCDDCRGL